MKSVSDTSWIAERAKGVGFDLCGVAPAEKFPELAEAAAWIANGYAGDMNYLSDPRRADPQLALPGARSVIVCAINYNAPRPRSTDVIGESESAPAAPRGWISRYAWGTDYHDVLRAKLNLLLAEIHERFDEPFESRAYADTGPLPERVFAKRAGLGWIGKNTLLLNQALGSWFFLGVILTTLDLSPSLAAADPPPPDLCGSCTRCIDACPTDALVEPFVMDARRCISYLTIEHRGSIPETLREPIGHHVFGCDICQDVCPWNRRAPFTDLADFQPRSVSIRPDGGTDARDSPSEPLHRRSSPVLSNSNDRNESLFRPSLEWLASLSEDDYKTLFKGSPIKRTKWRGLIRNACIALGNSKNGPGPAQIRVRDALHRLTSSPDTTIAESALWALSRIQ
jgi:epoxyqueuosine reductase